MRKRGTVAKKATSSTAKAARIEAVAKRIHRASELPQWVRVLIYGRSGKGKTRVAATAPNVLIIDVNDQGTDSVRRDIDPNVFQAVTWSDVIDIYWYLQAGDHEFESFAVDGITAMQALCMKFVLGDEAARDASRDPDMPSRPIYNKVTELMRTQITNFRNLPMNAIFTALTRTRTGAQEDDDDDFGTFISPGCSPAIADHLEASVGLIGHLTSKEVQVKVKGTKERRMVVRRQLFVGPSERYLTKDRYGVFPPYIVQPNLSKMIREIYGNKEDEE